MNKTQFSNPYIPTKEDVFLFAPDYNFSSGDRLLVPENFRVNRH